MTLRDPHGTATYEAEDLRAFERFMYRRDTYYEKGAVMRIQSKRAWGRGAWERSARERILESTKEQGITGDQGLTEYFTTEYH